MWKTDTEIFYKDIDEVNQYFIPREIMIEGEPWIKHIHCNGARFHVLIYSGKYNGDVEIRCSEKDCIYNKPKDE